MDLGRQKEIIQNEVARFNGSHFFNDYTLTAEWFVCDGDKWVLKRSDNRVIANYLDFDQALLVINSLSFYLEA